MSIGKRATRFGTTFLLHAMDEKVALSATPVAIFGVADLKPRDCNHRQGEKT
ncbi:hypothetical protein O7A70_07750 [Mesorhizobium sp. Cs1299R1N1]|uniref:hypothetical protein n=1 Tax=Mesorhizobium sp. Cs1299R1N1 TaxID=3015172 RepID=UPI00301C557E